ncbi:hypothetical protein LCGC14_0857300 [marine sediment metagenome]|uniref:Uncharacterized protein n=1 Tax=marine sediment metagenome TaxID=412755 RepID=A0A0F9PDC1_9ZZZZ
MSINSEVAEELWIYIIEKLRQAESIKWDWEKLRREGREGEVIRSQAIADTLRMVGVTLRNDPEFEEEHREDWAEFALGVTRIFEDLYCPIDRRVMTFNFQDQRIRRYTCTHEDAHVIEYYWNRGPNPSVY